VKSDQKVDALFQLPLDQFTKQRNALAKELAGETKKHVRFLAKPPLPIWAVNQLYWHDRPTHNALIDASEKLRAAHKAALSGRKADIRKAEAVHHAAVEAAIARTVALVDQSQGRLSDAARDTIRKTLTALPTDEQPGRLTRAPEAAGFSLLTGIPLKHIPARNAPDRISEKKTSAERDAAMRARKLALDAAERELQLARKAAEQARFKLRELRSELQRAEAEEQRSNDAVAAAETKLQKLRLAE
jgi:hypothetical protein